MAIVTVTNTNDSGPGSLRQAIEDAAVGDTIIFDLVLPATITLTSGELVLGKNLTIDGPGPDQLTISGNNSSRVFFTFTVNTIRNVTITAGSAGLGGGITAQGGLLTLENVRVVGNMATGDLDSGGGGIFVFNADLSITDCTIAGNSAQRQGGGLHLSGDCDVLIRDSVLENNRAVLPGEPITGPRGGGIFVSETSRVRLETSTVAGNQAIGTSEFPSQGGGIYSEGTLIINRSTVSGNSARATGGVRQQAGTFTTVNSTYSRNSSAFSGGAIGVVAGVCNISFCTIAENLGSGISVLGGGGSDVVTVNVKNSLLVNNTVNNCEGAIFAFGVNFSTDANCPGFTQVSTFDLNLQPLAVNPPGTTATHALGEGSVAINAAPDCTDMAGNLVTMDQRGVPRPQGTACDVGAYEFQFLKSRRSGRR